MTTRHKRGFADNCAGPFKTHAKESAPSRTSILAAEVELLLTQLHLTQEELNEKNEHLLQVVQSAAELEKRVNRFIIRHPDSFEFDELIPTLTDDTLTSDQSIRWTATNAYISNILYPQLEFVTFLSGGITGIIFERDGCPSINFFNSSTDIDELVCMPVKGAFTLEENARISDLSHSDWRMLNRLIPKLIDYLSAGSHDYLPMQAAEATASGLKKLSATLDNWPKVLRYDSIELTTAIYGVEYQALDLKLKNVEIGTRVFPTLAFRLSSINEPGNQVGQYPRLEFFEDARECFTGWYAESNDERGKRYELRFAATNEIDIKAWKSISDLDQLMIVAIIAKLPEMIEKLRRRHGSLEGWEDWLRISFMLKHILILITR